MNSLTADSIKAEEERIRAAYASREEGLRYSWFTPGHVYIAQQRERRLLALLRRCGFAELSGRTILEVGCGTGYWLREFIKWGARPENVAGIDLLPDRVRTARALCPSAVRIECSSAAALPFADEQFDLAFQSTMFTSILDPDLKRRIAVEMMRVVKRDGMILWYDYHMNNPWNSDVKGVKRREIFELFPNCRIDLERVTLIPPLARVIAAYSFLACHLLEKVPVLCSHYLGVIRKP